MKHILILLALVFSMAAVNAQTNSAASDHLQEEISLTEHYAQAFIVVKKTAEQGHVYAQYSVGLMYLQGLGVPENYVSAYMWFTVAAATNIVKFTGDNRPQNHKHEIAKRMSQGQISEALDKANKCLESKFQNCN